MPPGPDIVRKADKLLFPCLRPKFKIKNSKPTTTVTQNTPSNLPIQPPLMPNGAPSSSKVASCDEAKSIESSVSIIRQLSELNESLAKLLAQARERVDKAEKEKGDLEQLVELLKVEKAVFEHQLNESNERCRKLEVEKGEVEAKLVAEEEYRAMLEKADETRIQSLRDGEKVRKELEDAREESLKKEKALLDATRTTLLAQIEEETNLIRKRRDMDEAERVKEKEAMKEMVKEIDSMRKKLGLLEDKSVEVKKENASPSGLKRKCAPEATASTSKKPRCTVSTASKDKPNIGGTNNIDEMDTTEILTQWRHQLEMGFLDEKPPHFEALRESRDHLNDLFSALESFRELTTEDLRVSGIRSVMERIKSIAEPEGELRLGVWAFKTRARLLVEKWNHLVEENR